MKINAENVIITVGLVIGGLVLLNYFVFSQINSSANQQANNLGAVLGVTGAYWLMPGTGYNIPISVSASAALNSGGDFSAGDTFFDFGNGSQAGAPIYQSDVPTQTPTATSAAAEGNAAATSGTASNAPSPLGALSTGDTSTDWLLIAGLGAALVAGYILYKKGVWDFWMKSAW
jgi:LPXTG-motif cell wall-anchored protein